MKCRATITLQYEYDLPDSFEERKRSGCYGPNPTIKNCLEIDSSPQGLRSVSFLRHALLDGDVEVVKCTIKRM